MVKPISQRLAYCPDGEECNDYDELMENIENSYVEMLSESRSANDHTYKRISQNPYEFESDSLNGLEPDEENPYISIREDYLMRDGYSSRSDYENLNQLREDYLLLLGQQSQQPNADYENLKCRSNLDGGLSYTNVPRRRESFNPASCQLSPVKLPLKRSKSVPGSNTLNANSKYGSRLANGKASVNGRTSLGKPLINRTKDDTYLLNQLEFQKRHLTQLHKQHWNFRLKNAEPNAEINEYSSLFALDPENMQVPPELLISFKYVEEQKQIQLFIKECRNFGNLADKSLKLYLLPDKQSKQRSSLQSKTIGHVNNLIEKKSFEICSPVINKKFVFHCDQLEELTNSRTILISVWKNKRSLLDKNQCLGEVVLRVANADATKVGEEEDSKPESEEENPLNIKFRLESERRLPFSWHSLEPNLAYCGEVVLSIQFDPEKSQLKVEVLGCVNLLTKKRDVRSLSTFCKIELKRAAERRETCFNQDGSTGERKDINDNNDDKDEFETTGISNDSAPDCREKQVRFSEVVEEKSISASLQLVDSQKTVTIKNTICPKYNKLFVFNDVRSEQLEFTGLELSVWNCQTLGAAQCIAGLQLGKCSGAMNGLAAIASNNSKVAENCLQEELLVWQQLTDTARFNSWIKACLRLRPIDD